MDKDALDDFRMLMAEDLALIGQRLQSVKDDVTDDLLTDLMPSHKRQRFRKAIAEARIGVLQALDTLVPNESPSNDSLVEWLIERWQKMSQVEKELVTGKLRAAFTSGKKPVQTAAAS